MKGAFRILTAALALTVALAVVPGNVAPTKALACNAGWTKTQATKYFTTRIHVNADNSNYQGTYKMLAVGCYGGGDSEGFSVAVSWYSGLHITPPNNYDKNIQPSGPSYFHNANKSMTYWMNMGYWKPSFYGSGWPYFRMNLTGSGYWTITGTGCDGSFGIAGGTCIVSISSIP